MREHVVKHRYTLKWSKERAKKLFFFVIVLKYTERKKTLTYSKMKTG